MAFTPQYPQSNSAGILKKGIVAVFLVMLLDAVRMLLCSILFRDSTTSLGMSPLFYVLCFFFPLFGVFGAGGCRCCLHCFMLLGMIAPVFFILQGLHMLAEIPTVRLIMHLHRRCDPRNCVPATTRLDLKIESQLLVECLAPAGIGGVKLNPGEEIHNIGPEVYGHMKKQIDPGPQSYFDGYHSKLAHLQSECADVGSQWMNCFELAPGNSSSVDMARENSESSDDQRLNRSWWTRMWSSFLDVHDDPFKSVDTLKAVDVGPGSPVEDGPSGIVLIKGPHGLYEDGLNGPAFRRMYRCDLRRQVMKTFSKKTSIIGEWGFIALMLSVATFSIGQAVLWLFVTKLAHNLYVELRNTSRVFGSPRSVRPDNIVSPSITFGEAHHSHLDTQRPLYGC